MTEPLTEERLSRIERELDASGIPAVCAEVRRGWDCAAELEEVRAAIRRAVEELDSDDPTTVLGARIELSACANPKYRQVRPGVWADAKGGTE